MMSSPFTSWPSFTIAVGISILLTLVAAEVANLLLRRLTNRLVRPAASQARERRLANSKAGRWPEDLSGRERVCVVGGGAVGAGRAGVNVLPAVIVIGTAIVALGIGGRSVVADVVAEWNRFRGSVCSGRDDSDGCDDGQGGAVDVAADGSCAMRVAR